MKEKIKNGYFFLYRGDLWLKVGSRAYQLPIRTNLMLNGYLMFKDIDEKEIKEIYKPDGYKMLMGGENLE